MGVQKVRICVEELGDQSLEGDEVYVGVWVEKLKLDLDTALLNRNQRMIPRTKKVGDRLCFAAPFVVVTVTVVLSSLWHKKRGSWSRGAITSTELRAVMCRKCTMCCTYRHGTVPTVLYPRNVPEECSKRSCV
jgi:hypothetical protein